MDTNCSLTRDWFSYLYEVTTDVSTGAVSILNIPTRRLLTKLLILQFS